LHSEINREMFAVEFSATDSSERRPIAVIKRRQSQTYLDAPAACNKLTFYWLTTLFAGHSGLAVTCLTAMREDQCSNPTVGSCMFIVNITTIYSFGHGLHTLTVVPRSTQPSTHRGMAKSVSVFGLSDNNKWRWWVWFLAAYRRTHSPGRLTWSEGRRLLGPCHIHHMNQLNSRSGFELRWQHHKYCRSSSYYYYY